MTIAAGLRAAAAGVPFQPVAGVFGSDLARVNSWKFIRDPYSDQEVCVISALKPDFAVIHATEVSENGDVRVEGTPFWDRLMSRAAKRILITAERVVSNEAFAKRPELTLIPGFMVEAVAIVPKGAWPGSSMPFYNFDAEAVERYLQLSKTGEGLAEHLNQAPEAMEGVELDA
jgi:glutaconate CoA-transferase subunit A